MTTAYTSLLGLALPVTGELSGTWGDTVNDYITKYVDSSVAGTQTISGSQTAVTLTRANGGALSQAGSGATGSSQYQVINCTGNPAGTLTVTVDVTTGSPTLSNSTYSQTFAVINGTSTSQSVVVRATTTSGTSTGVTLVSGEKALIAWNGSDFIKVATSTVDGVSTIAFGTTGLTPSSATSGAVTVAGTLVAANGGTGQSSYTTGDLLYATGSTALSKLGIGTNGQILTSTGTAPQWSTLSGVAVTTFSAGTTGFTPSSATSGAVTLAGTLATTNGGTGLTSFTANGVVYASSSSALTTGSALSFDGTKLTQTVSTTAAAGVAEFKNSSTNAQTANIIASNDSGTALTMRVFGSAAGTYGMLVAGSPSIYTTASELNFVADNASGVIKWGLNGAVEGMRLTSTGLGIGTTSPAYKLDVSGTLMRVGVGAGAGAGYILYGASSRKNWLIASQYNVDDALEFTPSTANGGTTFSTPVMQLNSSGNLGLGVTPSAWTTLKGLQVVNAALAGYLNRTYLFANAYYGTGEYRYIANDYATMFQQSDGQHKWFTAASGTAGDPISFTQAMTLDANGDLGVGTTNPTSYSSKTIQLHGSSTSAAIKLTNSTTGEGDGAGFDFELSGNDINFVNRTASGVQKFWTNSTERARFTSDGNLLVGTSTNPSYSGYTTLVLNSGTNGGLLDIQLGGSRIGSLQAGSSTELRLYAAASVATTLYGGGTERARITAAGFTQPVAYADTVSALGNTGTAKTIDLQTANVFTATLTGNCTFTLSNPIATGSSSFTLILTNDGTAGRTVAWAGGSFVFPGGAASLSRTTTANAVDVWVFFTTNGGTTWYGNIAMKNMTA